MGFLYLACPHRHYERYVMEYREMKATQVAGGLIRAGITIYSPVSHRQNMINMPVDWEFWFEHDRMFLETADGLYVLCLPGWKDDRLTQEEINLAKALQIETVYLDYNGVPCGYEWEDLRDELLGNPRNLIMLG